MLAPSTITINERGHPVLKGGFATFLSTNTNRGRPVRGDVRVGVCGGRGDHAATVIRLSGIVSLFSAISYNGAYQFGGKQHGPLSHNAAIFKPQPGQTVYFRVSRVEAGQFTVEMMVEGGSWGHLTPNGEPLLPKTEEGEAMEGMRVCVELVDSSATVSDLRVGNQRKKPTKSANKRVQGVGVEGETAAVPRHYPSFSPLDAILFSSRPLPSRSLSFFFLLHSILWSAEAGAGAGAGGASSSV
jgi:hypothetical protein